MTALASWSSNTVHGSDPSVLLLRRLLVSRTYLRPRNRSHPWPHNAIVALRLGSTDRPSCPPNTTGRRLGSCSLLVLFPSMGRRVFLAMTSATPRRRSSLTRFLKAAGKRVVVGHVNVLISYHPASKQASKAKQAVLGPTMETTGSGEAERLGLLPLAAVLSLAVPSEN